MPEKEFNLLHEPWILVMRPNGVTEEVSILELFRNAPEWKGLAGELPTQDIAILRLLLAILHAVFGRYDVDGRLAPLSSPNDALRRWSSIWNRKSFPMEIIEDYLLTFEDRFYLFHPEYPFYQVAIEEPFMDSEGDEIKPTEKEVSSLIGDIAESDNKTRLFSSRTQKDTITYSEAARWLLYTNSFDVAPGGRPARSRISIKGYGISWLGKLGLIWANGSNLFETLLLNFVMATENNIWTNWDVVWEHDKICDAEDLKAVTPVFPQTPCELLTMQFRRIRLMRDTERRCVTEFRLWAGQLLNEENAFLEHMTVWKKNDKGGYEPKKHDASQQIWRDFSAILSTASDTEATAGVVEWIGWLRESDLLQIKFVQLNTAGAAYKQNTAITNIFTDSLSVNLSLFITLGRDWVNRISNEIDVTKCLVEEVGMLAVNIYMALGYKNSTRSDRNLLYRRKNAIKEQAYFRLDRPFRTWLEGIDPERDSMNDVCEQWWVQLKRIVRDLGKELVNQSGPQAFVGRIVKDDKNRERRHTAPEAYNRFLYRTSTRKALKERRGENA